MRRQCAAAVLLWSSLTLVCTLPDPHCHCQATDKLLCTDSPLRDLTFLDYLHGCPSPRVITVFRSSLLELPERAIRERNLAILSLPEDGIQTVHRRSFLGLGRLRDAHLPGNNIRFLHRDTFATTPLLATLNLDRNLLTDTSALRRLPSLECLSLSDNAISILHNESFSSPLLTNLLLANNEINTIESRAFQNLHKLSELDLSGNHIFHIHCNTFADASNLQELNLRNNELTHLDFICSIPSLRFLFLSGNAISVLPDKIFLGVLGLYRLDLANNAITTIELQAFEGLLHLADLDISGNRLTFLPVGTFSRTPQLQRLNLEQNQISKLDFVQYAIGLIHLSVANNDVRSLPSRTFSIFESALQSVDLSRNTLASIEEDALQGLVHLVSLNLSNTGVRELEPQIFRHAPNVTELDLRGNRMSGLDVREMGRLNTLRLYNNSISALCEDIFSNVSLQHVDIDLAGNRITTVGQHNFQGLEDVHFLTLSQNNISYIHPNAFTNISYFWKLDVSYNRISQLEFVRNISTLRILCLSNNVLSTLPNKAFAISKISQLHYIDLSNNSITKIERRAFQYLNNLWDLNLSHNNITFLSHDAFTNTTSLWDLNVSHNKIPQIIFFTSIPSLRSLNVSYNNITVISNYTFYRSKMTHLGTLDLSNNAIENIENWAFLGLSLLERLNLSGNRVRTLHRDTFSNVTTLRQIDLSSNHLTAVNGMRAAPHLEHCDLSRNSISGLKSDSFSPALRTLNLSRNRIATVDPRALQGLRLLERLDLSWNVMSTLGADTFRHCTALLELDLSGNLISQVASLHVPSLKHLHLSHNAISHLDRDAFATVQLDALTFLAVANNSMSTIEPRAFQTLTLLKYLDLSRNNLSSIDSDMFQNNTVLRALDISANRLSHLYFVRKIASLEILNTSSNAISVLPSKVFSSFKVSKLTHIDVSHNAIRTVESGALSGLVKLRYLDVSGNMLATLYPQMRMDVRRLRTLRCAQNPLEKEAVSGLSDSAVRLDLRASASAELEAVALGRRLVRHRKKRIRFDGFARM